MFDDVFSTGNSVIHRFDSRLKVAAAIVFSIVIALSYRWAALTGGLLLSILLVWLARLPFRKVCVRLIWVNGLVLFLWLFLPFSVQGSPLLTIGRINATKEGVLFAAVLTLRSNVILLCLISLVSTTPVFTLGRAIRQLGVPSKMVQLFFFTYRYLHVIHLEYEHLVKALKIRGFHPKTNMHTYKTYAYLVGMLLIRSYDRSERIRNAMLCRGFKGRFYDLKGFSLSPFDVLLMSLLLSAVAVIALLQWTKIIY